LSGEPDHPDASGLRQRLHAVVAAHLAVDPGSLQPEAELGVDLGVDSLMAAELVVVVEDALGLELADDVLDGMRTYGDLERAVDHAGPRLRTAAIRSATVAAFSSARSGSATSNASSRVIPRSNTASESRPRSAESRVDAASPPGSTPT
jgi:acyl carrier protein